MDKKLFELGLSKRKATLGKEYVEKNLDATNCAGTSSCHAGQKCNSHKLWDDLNSVVEEFLSDISITDLAEKRKDLHIPLKEIQS